MDPIRLRAFVEDEYPRVLAAVALVCGGDRSHAEDSVQEALARACDRERDGARIDNLAAWVTTVASNHGRSRFRRAGAERRALERIGHRSASGPPATDDPDRSADSIVMREAVIGLPRRQRQVVVLHYYLGLDLADIAEELGIATGTDVPAGSGLVLTPRRRTRMEHRSRSRAGLAVRRPIVAGTIRAPLLVSGDLTCRGDRLPRRVR